MMQRLTGAIMCAMAAVFFGASAVATASTGQVPMPDHIYSGMANMSEGMSGGITESWQQTNGNPSFFLKKIGETAAGWQDIDGQRYYFIPGTGEMATGWQDIEDRRYYFMPGTGEMATGWQDIEGQRYYFMPGTGEMLTDRQEIGGQAYFFGETGALWISGWAKTDNGTYYCGEDGCLVSGWKKIGGAKYYFLPENNRMIVGNCRIKGHYYIFRNDGRLARSGHITIVKAGGRIYCAKANGKAAGGWLLKGNKLYYANKKGVAKTDIKYQGITFTGTGAAKRNVESKLKIKLIRMVDSITSRRMSKKKKLAVCWSYITGGRFRYVSKYPRLNSAGWTRKTAYDMLSTHSGNCYSYACAFAALASEIGYKPYVVCGRVHGSRDRAADGYTRHAWVKINGKYYDPEAQCAGWGKGIYANRRYPVSHKIKKVVAYRRY